jgi:hypothetical protein
VSRNISITIKQGESFSGEVNGTLKQGPSLQGQCEALLAVYEAGKIKDAKLKLNVLKQKHPDSLAVKQLEVLFLYREGKFEAAYF